ncbi:MAG: glycoside hydrolase family 104 protein [Chitinophagales bacterium]
MKQLFLVGGLILSFKLLTSGSNQTGRPYDGPNTLPSLDGGYVDTGGPLIHPQYLDTNPSSNPTIDNDYPYWEDGNITTTPTGVPSSFLNVDAFLKVIQFAEGTYRESNPYSVTYGYDHIIQNFSDHPAITGEWTGKLLPSSYCTNAGLSAGCKSTAAGAYQIIKPTWIGIKNKYPNSKFDKAGQDNAAIHLIAQKNAIQDVENGNFDAAIYKINKIWASLPGSPYGQPTRSMNELRDFYVEHGGSFSA